jgi:hypothetical protein
MCKEICAEANTAHAFEFTAALSELQDFVPAMSHKFNHSTPCATNVTLPLSSRNDGFRIICWIAPAIKKTLYLIRIYNVNGTKQIAFRKHIDVLSEKKGRI